MLLDDSAEVYWTQTEKYYAIWEALRVWGALTNYWRARGTFPWTAAASSPWTDLSVALPALRPRTVTLDQLTREIQFMCLEAANGISGTGMSGQISVSSILQALQRARNRFALDTRLPLEALSVSYPVPPPDGLVSFNQSSVFVHRASWQDDQSSAWFNLWRDDAFGVDRAGLAQQTTIPEVFSESQLSPLQLQLSPIPAAAGELELIIVPSEVIDLTDPLSTFNLPDEWIHAVKYAALADLFSAESQNTDPLRANYAESRYQQALAFARDARSIHRMTIAGAPVPLDSVASLDAGSPYWRNQTGAVSVCGVMYDFIAFSPGVSDGSYTITAEVSQSAPIPLSAGVAMPIGDEELANILDYATHVLTFKCGGREFSQTFAGYNSFLQAVAGRKGINAAKVRYLEPAWGQPQREWATRPDRMEVGR